MTVCKVTKYGHRDPFFHTRELGSRTKMDMRVNRHGACVYDDVIMRLFVLDIGVCAKITKP